MSEWREEVAEVLEVIARDGLPEPRDLDVALDAIASAVSDEIEKLRAAVRGAEAWIGQWTKHVGNCRGDYRECTCGRAFVLRECQEVLGEKE